MPSKFASDEVAQQLATLLMQVAAFIGDQGITPEGITYKTTRPHPGDATITDVELVVRLWETDFERLFAGRRGVCRGPDIGEFATLEIRLDHGYRITTMVGHDDVRAMFERMQPPDEASP